MKRILFFLFFVAVMAAWCTPSFAADPAREEFSGPGGTYTMTTAGETNGVTLKALAGSVTNLNIPAGYDVFTFNKPLLTATSQIAISASANDLSKVNFLGNSTVYGDMGASGGRFAEIDGGAADTRVDILGNIYSTKVVFTADSTISLGVNKIADGGAAVTTTGGANTGTLVLGGGSRWGGTGTSAVIGIKSVNVEGSGVSATITGEVQTKSFSLLTNTLNIDGAMTIAADGVINTTLAGTGLTQYGHIVVGGLSTLGSNLTVRVTVPTTSLLVKGDRFYIVQSTSGLNALATVDPTNSLYTFSVVTTADAGDATIEVLTVPAAAPVDNPPADEPIVPIAAPVASVIIGITNPPADLASVIAAINALSNAHDVVNAEAQLSPLAPSLAAALVTFQGAREFQNLWLSRLDMCREVSSPDKDNSNCKGDDARIGWWLKGFGQIGNQSDRGLFKGYDSEIAGTMIAYDARIAPDTRLGFGIGYARSTIDGTIYDTNTSFDTYQGTAYIGHDVGDWFVHGSLSVGWNEYRGMRHIVFPGVDRTANSEYSGQDYTFFAKTGYRFSAPSKFTITPLASLQFTRVNIGGYTERDAGDVNLKVRPQGYNYLESGLGGKVERDFGYRGWTLVPEVHLEWLHKFMNPALAENVEFTSAGSAWATPGLQTSDDMYHVGTGISLISCACTARRLSLEGGYDYYWRYDGYNASQFTVKLTSRF